MENIGYIIVYELDLEHKNPSQKRDIIIGQLESSLGEMIRMYPEFQLPFVYSPPQILYFSEVRH
jgi:hypothetical protein